MFLPLITRKPNNRIIMIKKTISTIHTISIVMVTGISFGILMSIVSNAFVSGVDFLFNARNDITFLDFFLFGKSFSPAPLSDGMGQQTQFMQLTELTMN